MLRKISIDVSSFKKLISEEYIYVDKTQYIYDLITGGRLYFLSRPRRFGKSLLISTLRSLFEGEKELFKNLWIDKNTDYAWPVHPVIYFDFATMPFLSGAKLEQHIHWKIEEIAKSYQIDVTKAPSIGAKFEVLLKNLSASHADVVILIDEYDYPLVNTISHKEIALENHAILRNFYSSLKSYDEYIKFLLVTGVTQFSRNSLFSGMNNLNDISFDKRATVLLGYTKEEIEHYFGFYIDTLATSENISRTEAHELLKDWYDGYRFSDQVVNVYNPLSVLYCFHKKRFDNYWLETGASSFLIELLSRQYDKLENIEGREITSAALGSFEIGEEPLLAILFQAGYITIYDHRRIKYDTSIIDYFKLKFPNFEVAETFKKYVLAALTGSTYRNVDSLISVFLTALRENDIAAFCDALPSLLAHIPYHLHISKEKYYHSLFQQLLTLLNLEAQSEISTDKGRIDMVLQTKTHIYVFELKLNTSAQKALDQIIENGYGEKYRFMKKKLVLIGLSFKQEKNHVLVDYAIKDFQ